MHVEEIEDGISTCGGAWPVKRVGSPNESHPTVFKIAGFAGIY